MENKGDAAEGGAEEIEEGGRQGMEESQRSHWKMEERGRKEKEVLTEIDGCHCSKF